MFNDGKLCIASVALTPGLRGQSVKLSKATATSVGAFQNDQYTLTADKQLTEKDKLTARWFFSDNNASQPFGTGANNANSLPFSKGLPGSNRFLKLGWTRVLSGNVVNDARFGFSRFFFAQDPSEPIQLSDIGATRGNSAEFPAAYQLIISGGGPLVLGTGVNDNPSGHVITFLTQHTP